MTEFATFWSGLNKLERLTIREHVMDNGMGMNQFYLITREERPAGIHTVARFMQADPRFTLQMLRPDLFGA
jgi:hypothetical protein